VAWEVQALRQVRSFESRGRVQVKVKVPEDSVRKDGGRKAASHLHVHARGDALGLGVQGTL
jgi:hypothetical protein